MSREPKANPQHGRKANQKMKPYLVMEYLMRQTDENHAESADNIVAYLQELGIEAERRSIYRDIEEINKALWLLDNEDNSDIFAAEEAIETDDYDSERNTCRKFYLNTKIVAGSQGTTRHIHLQNCKNLAKTFFKSRRHSELEDVLTSLIDAIITAFQQ